jgi:glutamate--cysteine ligase
MTGLWAADDLGPDQCATVRTEHDVRGFVTRTCFKTGPPGRVGIESEWFVHDVADSAAQADTAKPADQGRHVVRGKRAEQSDRVSLDRLQQLVEDASPLPGGSALTFEPGGQLELSTACGDNLPHARDLLDGDLHHLDKLLTDAGCSASASASTRSGPRAASTTAPATRRWRASSTSTDLPVG